LLRTGGICLLSICKDYRKADVFCGGWERGKGKIWIPDEVGNDRRDCFAALAMTDPAIKMAGLNSAKGEKIENRI